MSHPRVSIEPLDVDPHSRPGREFGRRAMLQSLAGAFGAGVAGAAGGSSW